MINPLAYYKVGKRPIGVWIGGVLLVMEMLMQLRGVFIMDRLPVHSLLISAPLFLIAFVLILLRSRLGRLLGITFFILNVYMPMFVIPNLPFRDWWCVLVWWFVSALGIAALFSNQRWFDEKIVSFECGE